MTTLLHGEREKKNVTREITFINPRLLSVTSHVARVVNRNRANKTALRKIISITVSLPRFIIIRLLYYIRGQGLIIDRSNLLLFSSDEFELLSENVLLSFESRRVFHRTTFRRFNPSKILPQSLLDESLGEKLYNDSAQRETYIGIIKFRGTVS